MNGPVRNLVSRLHPKRCGKGWIAKCPAHEDHKPSLTIDEGADGRALIHCQAGCDSRDVLAALGMTFSDLFPATYTHPAEARTPPLPVHLKLNQTHQQAFDWCAFVGACTDKHVEQIAKWRSYSPEFVTELRDKGKIGIYNGMVAFPVYNSGKVVGTHYRLKDGNWLYFPKGIKAAPLVFGDLNPGDPVHVFESTWDGLDYMD